MEDLKIIQLYWEREESAIIQTKEKYGKTMEQLAYRLLFDYQDTEECCSDTYWDLWNALPPNRPIHFKAFIMRICRCNAMNRLELAVMFCMTQSSVKVSLFRMREQFKEMLVCQGVIESH